MDGRSNRVEIKLRFRISPAYCGRGLRLVTECRVSKAKVFFMEVLSKVALVIHDNLTELGGVRAIFRLDRKKRNIFG